MTRFATLLLVIPVIAVTTPALARDANKDRIEPPKLYLDLVDCSQVADPTARLACYDEKVAALKLAQESRDIVIADKAEIAEARKGLFGFDLPNIKLFGDKDDQPFQQIDTTLASARQINAGQWQLVLADGAVWNQIDTQSLAIDPRPGMTITIRRAALSSFMARIGNQPGVKVRRVK